MNLSNFSAFAAFLLITTQFLISCAVKTSDYLKTRTKQNGTLYYVKPTEFSVTNDVEYEFEGDFTINTSDTLDDPNVRMNFYLNGIAPIGSLKKLVFKPSIGINKDSSINNKIKIETFEKFFIKQKDKDEWVNRYSCKITYSEFLNILKSGKNLRGEYTTKDEVNIKFRGGKNWQKRKETLHKLFTHSIDNSTS